MEWRSGLYVLSQLAAFWLVVAFAYYVWRRWKRWWPRRGPETQALSLLVTAGLVAKGKVAFGFLQIVLVLPEALHLQNALPHEYDEWMRWLSRGPALGLWEWRALPVPLGEACFGGIKRRLHFEAVSPFVVLLVLFAASTTVHGLVRRRRDEGGGSGAAALAAMQTGILHMLPIALVLLFAYVPPISASIFSAFSCDEFGLDDDPNARDNATVSYLSVDLAVECDTAYHDALRIVAFIYMAFWPIGVPLLFATLLWMSRRAFVAKMGSVEERLALSKALSFLHAEYRPRYTTGRSLSSSGSCPSQALSS